MNEARDPGDALGADRPLVSIVIPALNEADHVPALLQRIALFGTEHPRYEFELILVDDGSTDGTGDLALKLAEPSDRVTVITLARSFGSHYAISAGLARCNGDAAVVFGADLQEPPSLLAEFLSRWEQGSHVVWGVRRSRMKRTFFKEIAARTFSFAFSRYAHLSNYPPEGPSGVLLDRIVIDEVSRMPEHNRNILALIAWLGYSQSRVDYDQEARRHGESKWTTRKMVKLAVDSLIQFSSMPLRLCTAFGTLVAFGGLVYALVLVVRSLLGVTTAAGWPTVIVLILLIGGTQLTVMGVIGEYLWRAVEESRQRPLYVVQDVRAAGVDQARYSRAARGSANFAIPVQNVGPTIVQRHPGRMS